MSAQPNTTQKTPISVFFLRTTAQAIALKDHIDELAGRSVCKIDHTIVYAIHENKKEAETLFNTVSRSLDAFNLKFITSAISSNWLEHYQTERSLGVFMMRLTNSDNIQKTINDFRVQSLVRLETQIDAYSVNTLAPECISRVMLRKSGVGSAVNHIALQYALIKAELIVEGFDFIDYSQLVEDVVRPICVRSLNENDQTLYSEAISTLLSDSQDAGTQAMWYKNEVFKHFSAVLSAKKELNVVDIPEMAMKLTKTFFEFKTLFATQSLSNEYKSLSNKRLLSVDAILAPIKTHKKSLSLLDLAKTA